MAQYRHIGGLEFDGKKAIAFDQTRLNLVQQILNINRIISGPEN
jgi:hypothetical protein